MKKPYNAFKAAQLANVLRLVILICVAGIILMTVLYFSVKENRNEFLSWLGFKSPSLSQNNIEQGNQKDAGLNGPLAINQAIKVRPIDKDDNLWGPNDAPVNLVIYSDFECPFCSQFYDVVNRAKAEFGNDLVVVIRHYPLANHEQALVSAMASECAAEKNKFWEMYHELFKANKTAELKLEAIIKSAETIGLEPADFMSCLTKERYKDKILAQKDEVKKLGVIGTPASFLNNDYLAGALPYEDFDYPDGTRGKGLKTLIQEKLNEAKK